MCFRKVCYRELCYRKVCYRELCYYKMLYHYETLSLVHNATGAAEHHSHEHSVKRVFYAVSTVHKKTEATFFLCSLKNYSVLLVCSDPTFTLVGGQLSEK